MTKESELAFQIQQTVARLNELVEKAINNGLEVEFDALSVYKIELSRLCKTTTTNFLREENTQ